MSGNQGTEKLRDANAVGPSEPYFIEVENNGCTCGAGRTWNVTGPDGVSLSTIYGDEEEAAYMAEMMNMAYEYGRAASPQPTPREAKREKVHETIGYETDYMRGRREMREEIASGDAPVPQQADSAVPTQANAVGNEPTLREAERLDAQLREILCERCLGTGIYSQEDALPEEAPPNPCSVCKGKGRIEPTDTTDTQHTTSDICSEQKNEPTPAQEPELIYMLREPDGSLWWSEANCVFGERSEADDACYLQNDSEDEENAKWKVVVFAERRSDPASEEGK